MQHPKVREIASRIFDPKANALSEKDLTDLGNIEMLRLFVRQGPIINIKLEELFTKIRKGLLLEIEKFSKNPQITDFLYILAIQCYINEYVFFQTAEEEEAVSSLHTRLESKGQLQLNESVNEILIFSSYSYLSELSCGESIHLKSRYKDLVKYHITDRKIESELKKNIPSLGELSDAVSKKVRDQYEENPYPRWVKLQKQSSNSSFKSRFRLQENFLKNSGRRQLNPNTC